MFFPDTPIFVADLLDVSLSTLLLGKRVDGSGGNGTLHRYFNRLRSNKVSITSKRKLLQLLTAMAELRPILKLPFLASDQLGDLKNSGSWQAFASGAKLRTVLPRTVNLINELDVSSCRIVSKFETGEHADAIHCLRQLPWASAETVKWYVGECERQPHNAASASFPIQLLSILAVLRAIGEEQRRPGDNQLGLLTPFITSRDPATGELVALRIWLDRVQEALGLPSQNAMFKIILRDVGKDDVSRIREGRRYRSGSEVPSVERVRRMTKNIRKLLSKEESHSLEVTGIFACFLQKALLRNKLVAQSLSNFDPMMPFDDWSILVDLNIDQMLPPSV